MEGNSLEDFVQSVSGTGHLRVEHDFGDGFYRLRTSEAERRQAAQDIQNTESIVLELLRNARDAHAKHIYIAMSREGGKRDITVIDDGDGIPESMHEHVFEPRVTSKLDTNHMDAWGMHGRGMALYSVRVNAKQAYVAQSNTGLGCAIHVQTDLASLGERKDQSSFPTFELTESGTVNIRGPRNILRTTCEFAIEERDACSVFVGSQAEVAATLYEYGLSTLSSVDRAFCRDRAQLPIVKRLATIADPDSFVAECASMGLELSSRTARRILNGELAGLSHVLDLITFSRSASAQGKKAKANSKGPSHAPRFNLTRKEAMELSRAMKREFKAIADSYYLQSEVEPNVRAYKDRIVVTIPVIAAD